MRRLSAIHRSGNPCCRRHDLRRTREGPGGLGLWQLDRFDATAKSVVVKQGRTR